MVLISSGFAMLISVKNRSSRQQPGTTSTGLQLLGSVLLISSLALAATLIRLPRHPNQAAVLFYFVQLGAVIFGSGYVLVAFLQRGLVDVLHWLSKAQVLDAIAVGQFTPGPVFSTAAFIGYLMCGVPGAVLATVGIFLPAFVFVAITTRNAPQLRASPDAAKFLDGVNSAAIALMLGSLVPLAGDAIKNPIAAVICLISGLLLLRCKWNAGWLIIAGAGVGVLISKLVSQG
jgi:chromate transporter